MFIRKKIVHSKRTGVSSAYYQLMESRNTEKGPRNTVLLHLGRLDITNKAQKILSTLIDRNISYYGNMRYEFKPDYFLFWGFSCNQDQSEKSTFDNPLGRFLKKKCNCVFKTFSYDLIRHELCTYFFMGL